MRQTLSAADPGSASRRHDVSVSLTKVGDVLRAQGDLPLALQRFEDSLQINQSLSSSDPSSASLKRDLVGSMWRLATIKDSKATWGEVAHQLQQLLDNGILEPSYEEFLEQAERLADQKRVNR